MSLTKPTERYRRLSYWHDTVPGPLEPADPLDGDIEADVAIAGAGLTGMWTAYYLNRANPGLRIALCEADIAVIHRRFGDNFQGVASVHRRRPSDSPCTIDTVRSGATVSVGIEKVVLESCASVVA